MPLDPNWDPDEAKRALTDPLEAKLYDGESTTETAKRILQENAPLVAKALVHMAVNSPNEGIRLRAGQYIIDRNLGRVGDSGPLGHEDTDPLTKLVKEITREVHGIKAS